MSKILVAKYCPDGDLSRARIGSRPSHVWRGVMKVLGLFITATWWDRDESTLRWKHSSNGQFSVKSAYTLIKEVPRKRGVDADMESIVHVTKDCWWARELLARIGLSLPGLDGQFCDPADWLWDSWGVDRAAIIGKSMLRLMNAHYWPNPRESLESFDSRRLLGEDVEGVALLEGFRLAERLGIRKACFQLDSLKVIKPFLWARTWEIGVSTSWLEAGVDFLRNNAGWTVMPVRRDDNLLADFLASKARREEWSWISAVAIPRCVEGFV
ncbi:hypothetical protein QQ045_024990 [Rhodiola kirilowii]